MRNQYEYVYTENKQFEKKSLDPSLFTLGSNDVLVKPHYVGICGSDLFLIHSKLKNLRLGHEWVGEVLSVGENVKQFKVGGLVTGTGHFACGLCEACKTDKSNLCENSIHFSSDKMGALRTSFVAPESQIYGLNAPLDAGLALIEIFAVGEQAYQLLQDSLRPQGRILIFGAGPIGLATAAVLKSYKLDVTLIEKINVRLEKAKTLGFSALGPQEAMLNTDLKNKFDVLIDCSNDYSGDQGAFRWLNYFSKKEYTALIVGKYVNEQSLPQGFNSKSAKLIWMRGVASGILKKTIEKWQAEMPKMKSHFISHEFTVDRVTDAFEISENKSESFKVVIQIK